MARENKTEYAILGMLAMEPMSGYDMKQFVSETIHYFWQQSYGQIYPTLKNLRERKLVTRKVEHHKGRPDRHVYSITATGRKLLEEWLREETDPEPTRIELLLKLFFSEHVEPSVSLDQISHYRKYHQDKLTTYRLIEKRLKDEAAEASHYPYWMATVRMGIHVARARIKWCDEAIDLLGNSKLRRKSHSSS